MMQSVDTNVLVRAFLEDDVLQARQAQDLLKEAADHQRLFISSYALLEFVWVLKIKKITRPDIYNAVITLADTSGTTIGQRTLILMAAEKYLKGQADFGDYMIMAESESQGVHQFKTFDQAILKEVSNASRP